MKHSATLCQTTAALLALSMLTTSCSSSEGGSSFSQVQTAVASGVGAALGAAAGAVIAKSRGSNAKDTQQAILAGMAIGTAAAAIINFAWQKTIVKPRQEYATTAQYVSANNAQLTARIGQAREFNKNLQNKKLTPAEKNSVSSGIAVIKQDLTTAESARKEASGDALAELNQKIAELKQEKSIMEKLAKL